MSQTQSHCTEYATPEETNADDVRCTLVVVLERLEAKHWPPGNGATTFRRGVYLQEDTELPEDVEGLVQEALNWAAHYEQQEPEPPKYVEIKGRSFGSPSVHVGPVTMERVGEPIFREDTSLHGSVNLHPPASKSWERLGAVEKFQD